MNLLWIALVLLTSFSPFSSADEDLTQAFLTLAKRPQPNYVKNFQTLCALSTAAKKNLNFDGDPNLANALKQLNQKGTLLGLRAILFAYQHCTDGAGAEQVRGFLGNEVLLAHPARLLQVISEQKDSQLVGEKLVKSEYFTVECKTDQAKCLAGRKAMWQSKREALEKTKMAASLDILRNSMIQAIPQN